MDYNTSPEDKNYLNLSPCSKTEIYRTLKNNGGCFILETDKVKRPPISVQVELSSDIFIVVIVVTVVTTICILAQVVYLYSKDNK